MTTRFKLVPYSNDDYDFVYETKKNAYKHYVELNYGEWNEEQQREFYKEFLNSCADEIEIIMLDDEKIGFVNGRVVDEKLYEQGNICIIPKHQGKGLGTEYLTNLFKTHSDKNINLRVFKQNPAQNLYKRLGFEFVSETKTHYYMTKKQI